MTDAGNQVSLCGWVARRREHGEHLAFVDLRDRTGVVQCVVDGAADLRNEYVVRITGTVRERPEGTVNPGLGTGEVEVGDCTVEVLNVAEPPPFPLHDRIDTDENVRLKYRFVDLRRERLQRNLRVRAEVNQALRVAMDRNGFVEIETPMLIASTPEGARDFIVPSRLSPGRFYALPQSPQLFKQLCMVGGLDRYYQIARCLRDEDLRADRQFEFMQLDMEASFVGQQEVQDFITEAVSDAAEAVTGTRPESMGRITWHEAIDRYGSDKPDTRFGMELVELTEVFAQTEFNAFKVPCIKGIRVAGQASLGRNKLDGLTDDAKRWGAKGLVWLKVTEDDLESPIAKFLSDDEKAGLRAAVGAESGDLILIVAGEWDLVCHVLGLLRLALGRMPVTEGGLTFLWVVDFPLFESLTD
ncbi:MAG: aspartate--tRNA ligase, partial [Acidimicrobiia bacterium]|nr:aspartate--tRNA ligase [Acidimicrobiia bacterium]